MKFTTVDEIFETNRRFDEKLRAVLAELSEESAAFVAEDETWSAAHAVEHIAIVEDGIAAICRRLLGKAEKEGLPSTGLAFSSDFIEGANNINGIKLEAPEMVKPTGGASMAESLVRLDSSMEKIEQLKPQFASYDCNTHKFPHPYLGGLSAAEWLALSGFHKYRHILQIRKLVQKLS